MNLIFFITTKSHYGRFDLHEYTLNNFIKQNGQFFSTKIVSIKQFCGDEVRTKELIDYFSKLGFNEIRVRKNEDSTIKDNTHDTDYAKWLLGNYYDDITGLYLQDSEVLLKNEFSFLLEDDSPLISSQPFSTLTHLAQKLLNSAPFLFSVHCQREGQYADSPNYLDLPEEFKGKGLLYDCFYNVSHDYNFQPQWFRTMDMIRACAASKQIPEARMTHTERAIKYGINAASKTCGHLSFDKRLAHSIHIGVPDSQRWIDSYKLIK